MDDYMKAGVLAALYGLLTGAWLYTYSTTTFTLYDTIDFGAMYRIQESIAALALTGFLIAASVLALLLFCRQMRRSTRVAGGILGSVIGIIMGAVFFSNVPQYLAVMLFHLLGTLWVAYPDPAETKGPFSRMREGWGNARRLMTLIGIGALVAGFMFVSADKGMYEAKFRESVVNATGGMDIAGMMGSMDMSEIFTRGDIAEMVEKQELSQDDFKTQSLEMQGITDKEDVRQKVIAQYEASPNWASIPASQKASMVDQATDDTWDALNEQIGAAYEKYISPEEREKRVDAAYEMMRQQSSSQAAPAVSQEAMAKMTEKLFDEIPIMKAMMQFLPILSAFIAFSAVTFFGTVFVSPFAAAMALFLKEKEKIE